MTNFQDCIDLFATARDKAAGKPVQNNTRLMRRADDCFAIRFHATDVVTLFEDGRVVLDTGGWATMSSKDRIVSHAPVRIESVRGVWYVSHKAAQARSEAKVRKDMGFDSDDALRSAMERAYNYDITVEERDKAILLARNYYRTLNAYSRVPYFDGIMFDGEGNCMNGILPKDWREYVLSRDKMTKRIQKYCTGFNAALAKKGIPMPGPGDCWGCGMRYADDGTDPMGTEHLISHLEEGYYVPSLAVNALRAKGYADPGVYMLLCMNPDNDIMGGPGSHYRASDGRMGGNAVRRALRDYLFDRLLPVPPSPMGEQRAPVRAANTNY